MLKRQHGLRVLKLIQILIVVCRVSSLHQTLLLRACCVLNLKVGKPCRRLVVRHITQGRVRRRCCLESLQPKRSAELFCGLFAVLLGLECGRGLLGLRHLLCVPKLTGLLVGLLRGQALLLLVVELLHRIVVGGIVARAYKLVLRKLIV